MCSKTGGVPFHGTKEQEEELLQVIAELKDDKGALMPILQKTQEIYGYLPIEVQTMISVRERKFLLSRNWRKYMELQRFIHSLRSIQKEDIAFQSVLARHVM